MTKPKVDPKFIVNLKGKEYVKYEGLLDMGHQIKLKSIKTDIIQIPAKENEMTCIVKAVITTSNEEVFEGIGDASPASVTNMLIPAIIRMAETRAKARALRDLTNIGITAVEELGKDEDSQPMQQPRQPQRPQQQRPQQRPVQQGQQQPQGQQKNYQCSSCGVGTNANVAAFSSSKFGKVLCRDCQNKARG